MRALTLPSHISPKRRAAFEEILRCVESRCPDACEHLRGFLTEISRERQPSRP